MAYVPKILSSILGRRLGVLKGPGYELVNSLRDGVYPLVVYANVAAGTAVSNTTTETGLFTTYSIPAGVLRAGSVIRFRWQGIATSTNSTDTLQIKAYINSTAVATGTATDVANNDMFDGECTAVLRTVGSSGTFVATALHSKVPAASNTATRVCQLTASTAIDTTAAVTITVKATWSVASASNSVRGDMLVIEIA